MLPDPVHQIHIALYSDVYGSLQAEMILHGLTVAEDDRKPRCSDWVIQCWVSQ